MQQPDVDGGLPKPKDTVFHSPQQTFVFRTSDGQMFIGSPLPQDVRAELSKPATVSSQSDKFRAHFQLRISIACGIMFILMGLVIIGGGVLECKARKGYSDTNYASYWCGASIIFGAGFVIYAAYRFSGLMIIVEVVANIICLTFAIIALVLSAVELRELSYYRYTCVENWSYFSCKDIDMMSAGYAMNVAAASVVIILSLLLVLEISHTIFKGCSKKPNFPSDLSPVTFQVDIEQVNQQLQLAPSSKVES